LLKEIAFLLVTANDVERDAMLRLVHPPKRRRAVLRRSIGQATYYLAALGDHPVVLFTCKAGSVQRDSAALAVAEAIKRCRPKAVVGVGIAFGGYTDKLKIGDALVSSKVIAYEPQRLQTTGAIQRGPHTDAGPILFNRFTNVRNWKFVRPDRHSCRVKDGPILSGEKLVDDLDFKVSLFSQYPEAIGGEMEGTGMAAACSRAEARREWILVKSVSDWGDGTKGDRHRPLAAAVAASLVAHVLSEADATSGL
jgi:nucleoside phosphorylase